MLRKAKPFNTFNVKISPVSRLQIVVLEEILNSELCAESYFESTFPWVDGAELGRGMTKESRMIHGIPQLLYQSLGDCYGWYNLKQPVGCFKLWQRLFWPLAGLG